MILDHILNDLTHLQQQLLLKVLGAHVQQVKVLPDHRQGLGRGNLNSLLNYCALNDTDHGLRPHERVELPPLLPRPPRALDGHDLAPYMLALRTFFLCCRCS